MQESSDCFFQLFPEGLSCLINQNNLESKLVKIIGIQKHAGKVRKFVFLDFKVVMSCHEPFFRYILFKNLQSFRALDSEMRSDRLREHQEKASDIAVTNFLFIDSFLRTLIFEIPTVFPPIVSALEQFPQQRIIKFEILWQLFELATISKFKKEIVSAIRYFISYLDLCLI